MKATSGRLHQERVRYTHHATLTDLVLIMLLLLHILYEKVDFDCFTD